MPLISVITAVRDPNPGHLREAAAGVAAQRLPSGWELEWLVQEDGAAPSARELCPGARYESNGAQLGTGTTRNFALTRARGELVAVLDHDDVLLPHGLATLINVYAEHPGIGWAVGQADDLIDGTRVPYPLMYEPGIVPAGSIGRLYEQTGLCQVACAGLVMPTGLVRAFGGWGALPRAQDVALLIAVSELFDGYQEPSVTWLYRKHPDQTTHASKTDTWREQQDRFIRDRLHALRTCRFDLLSAAPPDAPRRNAGTDGRPPGSHGRAPSAARP